MLGWQFLVSSVLDLAASPAVEYFEEKTPFCSWFMKGHLREANFFLYEVTTLCMTVWDVNLMEQPSCLQTIFKG